jgi:hypothetical protein
MPDGAGATSQSSEQPLLLYFSLKGRSASLSSLIVRKCFTHKHAFGVSEDLKCAITRRSGHWPSAIAAGPFASLAARVTALL